jgi:hypothetical protein
MKSAGMIVVPAVVKALKAYRFNYSSEKELQEGVERVLSAAMIPFEREKILGEYGTIDFLVDGHIGIEIKTKGSPSAVARQLVRYFKCGDITELILLTGRSRLGKLPATILGKKLTVVTLWETFL